MKIEYKRSDTVPFLEVATGQTFEYSNKICIKALLSTDRHAGIHLVTGYALDIHKDAPVKPVKLKVVNDDN